MPEPYEDVPGQGYLGSPLAAKMAVSGRLSRPTNTEMLQEKKRHLESELARVNAALEALQSHPEIEKVMNLVSQALY